MANINKVFLGGNVVRDIEVRYSPDKTAVAQLSICVNNYSKDKEEPMFIEVVFFGKNAERLKNTLKGTNLWIEGYLKQDNWIDKDTGAKRSKHKVTGLNFQFLNKKGQETPRDFSAEVSNDDIPF